MYIFQKINNVNNLNKDDNRKSISVILSQSYVYINDNQSLECWMCADAISRICINNVNHLPIDIYNDVSN